MSMPESENVLDKGGEEAHNVIINRVGDLHEILSGDGGEREALDWQHSLDDLPFKHAG